MDIDYELYVRAFPELDFPIPPDSSGTPGLVTVVIPAFNAVDHIHRAIKSIDEQTYKNKELIVVDDGSSDGTSSRARDLVSGLPFPATVIELKENRGACFARNEGLRASRGQWIIFLDADDWFHNEKISASVAAAESDYDLVVSGYRFLYKDGSEANFYVNFALEEVQKNIISRGQLWTASTMYPREIVKKAGGWMVGLDAAQDWEFSARCVFFASRIKCVDQVLATSVREVNGSISLQPKRKQAFAQLKLRKSLLTLGHVFRDKVGAVAQWYARLAVLNTAAIIRKNGFSDVAAAISGLAFSDIRNGFVRGFVKMLWKLEAFLPRSAYACLVRFLRPNGVGSSN